MYRFLLRPRWLAFHALVVVGVVVMINLGFWQLRRLDDRQAFNALIEARYDQPPVPIDELLVPGVDPDDVSWRPVTASGIYRPDESLLVVNRSQNGRAGVNAVVPLELDDDRIVLVNRGFVPLTVDPPPAAPAGEVDVLGRLRPAEERRLGQLSDPSDGELDEVQRLDLDRLDAQFDGRLAPMYVDLIESSPAEADGFPEPVIAPDLSEGNHLSYAVQWFIFAIAVVVGWVLAVRRSAATRRHRDDNEVSDTSLSGLDGGHSAELFDDVG